MVFNRCTTASSRKGKVMRPVRLLPLVLLILALTGCYQPGRSMKPEKADESEAKKIFQGDLFRVTVDIGDEKRVGFIDIDGNVIIEPQFKSAYTFHDGLAPVKLPGDAGTLWGYIDKSGEFVIKPAFIVAHVFEDGLAFVETKETKGWIDTSGVFKVQGDWQAVGPLKEGIFFFKVKPEVVEEGDSEEDVAEKEGL